MNKLFKRVIAVGLLLAMVVTGGFFTNFNQEAEAAQATIKPCSHTTITTNCNGKSNTVHNVKVVTKKGTYSHTHTHAWAHEAKTETNQDDILTKTLLKSRALVACGLKDGKRNIASYCYTDKVLGIQGKTKQVNVNGQYKCPECQLAKTSATGTITIKTPCCGKTVKINAKTGKRI